MNKRQKEQRDKRDNISNNIFFKEKELQNILKNKMLEYRNKGFTWAEIHYELFKLYNIIAYDVEIIENGG